MINLGRAVAANAIGLMLGVQLLGFAVSDPDRLSPAPESLRDFLVGHPSYGVLTQLRENATSRQRSFLVPLPEEWWPGKGRAAAAAAFVVFVDGRRIPVLDRVTSSPPGGGHAERRERGDSALLIRCASQDACGEAWVIRRSRWLRLALQVPETWARSSVLFPFALVALLVVPAAWVVLPIWSPVSRVVWLSLLGAFCFAWPVLLLRSPASAWLLTMAEILIFMAPIAVAGARSALRESKPGTHTRLAAAVALGLLWVGALYLAFRPGLISPDSLDMYLTGMSGHYRHNVYPVVVSFLYGLMGRAFGSPAAVLLTQLLGLALGMSLLARPWASMRGLLVLASFLAAPPIWSVGIALWSDVALALALLWCAVALVRERWLAALFGLLASSSLRHNAILATAPLMLIAVSGAAAQGRRRARWIAFGLAVAVGLSLPSAAARLAGAQDVWPGAPAFVWDIVSISRRHPELWEKSVLRNELQTEQLPRLFNPGHANPLFNPAGPPGKRLSLWRLRELKSRILEEWRAAVASYPMTYAAGRAGLFLALLGTPGAPPCYGHYSAPNEPGYEMQGGPLQLALERAAVLARSAPILQGWFWCLILVAEAATCLAWTRLWSPRLWLAVSGLSYIAGYIPFGQGCDFRFLYWPIVASFAAAVAPPWPIVASGVSDATRQAPRTP